MRTLALSSVVLFASACGSPPPVAQPAPPPTPAADPEPVVDQDPTLYKEYKVPAEWPEAFDDVGTKIGGGHIAKAQGDRQVVLMDSASTILGHEGKLKRTVFAVGSHCGKIVAETVNNAKPLAIIANDAGIGLHSAGIVCIPYADKLGLPAATVSANTAYMGVVMSLWTTGKISNVSKAAAALGVKVGMTTQEAADIFLAKAQALP